MATSGYKNVLVSKWDTLKFSWNETSQSISNNTTTISWKMQLISTDYGRISSVGSNNWKIVINGTEYTGKSSVNIGNNATKLLADGTTTIKHNSDGKKSFSYSFSQDFNITFSGANIGTVTGLGTGTLDTIPRAATITAAPNFDDEDNPTITYSNPAGSAVASLEACISLTGATDDIAYRSISKTGTSYTFNLTAAERKILREATTSNSRQVRFYVQCVIGGETYRKYLTKTFSISSGKPTLNPTALDVSNASYALTGDRNKIIKGFNKIEVAANASANKEATIKSYNITCGGKVITSATGSFTNADSGSIRFSVTDSRGNTTTQTLNKTLINYIPLTCNIVASPPTIEGNLEVTVRGNYFNGSFGAVNNTLKVELAYKTESGDYGSWVEVTPTISSNSYTAVYTLSGLDYLQKYTFKATASDKIKNNLQSAEKALKTLPVFDWGENDFNFNVPVTLTKGNNTYSLLGLLFAVTTTYELATDITLGDNYTSGSATAHLVGNSLRIGINATRSGAVNVGNITNETVMVINVHHGGKINNLYRVDFNSGTEGGAATFDVQASKVDDDTYKLTVTLCATTTAATGYNAYFAMPCTIVTKAYL